MSGQLKPFRVRPQDGEAHWILGGLYSYKAVADQVGGAYTAVEVRAGGGMAIPVHYHDEESEAFYVAEGAVTLLVDQDELAAPQGSFLWVPAGVPHAFRFETDGRMLLLFAGGTGHEGLFRAIGEPATTRTIPAMPDVLPEPDDMAVTASQFGTRIVGPPFV